MASHIGLPSDHALPEDARCLAVIEEYASDEAAFRRDFSAAYTRMVTLGARWA
jgi:L-ascorbate peroxidase